MNTFGKRIKMLRTERNWSMKTLGEKIGEFSGTPTAQTTISNWENKDAEPPYNILIICAHLFNVSTDYLVGNSDRSYEEELLHEQKNVLQEKENDLIKQKNELEKSKEIHIMAQDLYKEMLKLPPKKREIVESELTEYLEFWGYKNDKLQSEFENFLNYIQHEIKNSSVD
ncbi:transcriptional regulator [[Bacillus thuringiensis] serovar konkukian]|nr:helix-turn-helix transcriptional regulator [Bacillus thuringiensis]MED1303825.1 helix-turn-helix transcriptional regulator [Bacillus pacificus]OUB10736.1 transcriptional regulator [[Bacillus thuringiensis] serovar konkukian]